jgi:hypothetical protein
MHEKRSADSAHGVFACRALRHATLFIGHFFICHFVPPQTRSIAQCGSSSVGSAQLHTAIRQWQAWLPHGLLFVELLTGLAGIPTYPPSGGAANIRAAPVLCFNPLEKVKRYSLRGTL